jgi:hypothetical protein
LLNVLIARSPVQVEPGQRHDGGAVAVRYRPVPDPDRQTVARLAGTAQLHAPRREPTKAEAAAAVEELREIAAGRGDLLAEAAGLLIGFYRRTVGELRAQAAAGFCIAAGADPDLVPRWIDVGLRRAAAARRVPASATGVDDPRAGTNRWRTVRYNV